MTGPCQLESEMFFCLLFSLTLYGFVIICLFFLSMSFFNFQFPPAAPFLPSCFPAVLSFLQFALLHSSLCLFSLLLILICFLSSFFSLVALFVGSLFHFFPRFIAQCQNAVSYPLVVSFSLSFVCLLLLFHCQFGAFLVFFFLFTFTSFCSLFLGFHHAVYPFYSFTIFCTLNFSFSLSSFSVSCQFSSQLLPFCFLF